MLACLTCVAGNESALREPALPPRRASRAYQRRGGLRALQQPLERPHQEAQSAAHGPRPGVLFQVTYQLKLMSCQYVQATSSTVVWRSRALASVGLPGDYLYGKALPASIKTYTAPPFHASILPGCAVLQLHDNGRIGIAMEFLPFGTLADGLDLITGAASGTMASPLHDILHSGHKDPGGRCGSGVVFAFFTAKMHVSEWQHSPGMSRRAQVWRGSR